jgi:hypothetical protein
MSALPKEEIKNITDRANSSIETDGMSWPSKFI